MPFGQREFSTENVKVTVTRTKRCKVRSLLRDGSPFPDSYLLRTDHFLKSSGTVRPHLEDPDGPRAENDVHGRAIFALHRIDPLATVP